MGHGATWTHRGYSDVFDGAESITRTSIGPLAVNHEDAKFKTVLRLPAVLVALLFARLAWFVVRNVVNVPFMDEWYVWSDLLEALEKHTLSWGFLVSPYNGHRIAVGRLVLLALLPTGWNVYPQVILTLLLTAAFLAVLWHQYRRTARELGLRIDPWAAVVLAVLVLSCSDINRLWGMGQEWHVLALGSTLCLMLLSVRPFRWWRLLAAALSAGVASFSIAAGLLAWVFGIPVLWIATRAQAARARAIICWAAGGVAFCALYLRNFPELGRNPAVPFLTHPREFAQFVLIYVGIPIQLRFDLDFFFWFGTAGIVLSATGVVLLWKYWRAALVPLAPWLAVAALSVAGGIMIAAARLPVQGIVALYYVTLARLFWISLFGVLCLILARTQEIGSPRWAAARRRAVPVIALVLMGVELRQGQVVSESWRLPREALLQAADDAPDVCSGNWETSSRVTFPADALRSRYPVMARNRLSFTRGVQLDGLRLVTLPASSVGAVERAIVEPPQPGDGPACVHLSGWARDPESGGPAREVLLVWNHRVIKRGAVIQATPEIAARFGNAELGRSGWALFVSRERWLSDPSSLTLYAVSRDRSTAYALGGSLRIPSAGN
jgi:hypothetical protein